MKTIPCHINRRTVISFERCCCRCAWDFSTGVKGKSWPEGGAEAGQVKGRAGRPVSTGGGSYPAVSFRLGSLEALSLPCPLQRPSVYGLTAGNVCSAVSSKDNMIVYGTTGLIAWCPTLGLSRALLSGPWHAAQETDT